MRAGRAEEPVGVAVKGPQLCLGCSQTGVSDPTCPCLISPVLTAEAYSPWGKKMVRPPAGQPQGTGIAAVGTHASTPGPALGLASGLLLWSQGCGPLCNPGSWLRYGKKTSEGRNVSVAPRGGPTAVAHCVATHSSAFRSAVHSNLWVLCKPEREQVYLTDVVWRFMLY